MDGLINMAKKGVEAYNDSQNKPEDAKKTGGQEYNSPSNRSGRDTPSDIDEDEVVKKAEKEGAGDGSLFSAALSYLKDNKGARKDPIDEEGATKAHKEAYEEGKNADMSANALGSAAALHVLKTFTQSSTTEKKSQTDLISMAMAEASKLFDKSGGSASSGGKQDAVNSAGLTIMKLLVQSKFSGAATTGGSDSGGLGGLINLASQFATKK